MARWRRTAQGGVPGAVAYDWRYLAADGTDVTQRMLLPGVEAERAEAVQDGTGTVLVTVRKDRDGWRATGGHLTHAIGWEHMARAHGSPFDALAYLARHAGLDTRER